MFQAQFNRRWPAHGWLGLGLVALFGALNWALAGMRTHYLFFPLWLGYCLTIDAVAVARRGDSLLTRGGWRYAGLFIASIPAWWLFELLNSRVQNWYYLGRELFSDLEYAILASLSFSTVIPAVFGTAEVAGTFRWIARARRWRRLPPSPRLLVALFAAGWVMLALLLAWPRYCFPFMWLSVLCILEPLNVWLGNRSLFRDLAEGDWRPVLALFTGGLICGFFWEMWNYWSYPKWAYDVPFVGVLHVFEMPLLGFSGYLPFALELFALYHLVSGLIDRRGNARLLRLTPGPPPNPGSAA